MDRPAVQAKGLSFLTGRILNRFSKDMGFVDDMMPFTYCDFLQVSLDTHYTTISSPSVIVSKYSGTSTLGHLY